MKSSTLIGVLLCTLLATPASAQLVPDLTGTWVGKWSCKGFDGTKFTDSQNPSTLQITQTGSTFAADLDNGGFHYNGAVIADVKNALNKPAKGEAVFAQCGNDNQPLVSPESEIVRASVKTKPASEKATLSGLSIFENDGPNVGTCKYSYKRTSLTPATTVNPCL